MSVQNRDLERVGHPKRLSRPNWGMSLWKGSVGKEQRQDLEKWLLCSALDSAVEPRFEV